MAAPKHSATTSNDEQTNVNQDGNNDDEEKKDAAEANGNGQQNDKFDAHESERKQSGIHGHPHHGPSHDNHTHGAHHGHSHHGHSHHGHAHHGKCGHGGCQHDHSDLETNDDVMKFGTSLFQFIDRKHIKCLNEGVANSGNKIFKPFDDRLDSTISVESNIDGELLFTVYFTAEVQLRSVQLTSSVNYSSSLSFSEMVCGHLMVTK